jgi:thiol-disulfide isomerase/thioredoxin
VKLERSSLRILLAGLLFGAGLGVLILFGFGGASERLGLGKPQMAGAALESPQVGSPAPDFELETLDGERVSLSGLRGRPVLINFWATWCGPCVIEMPNIQEYYEKYPGEFAVLAVNGDEPLREVQKFVEDMGLTFDILLDPGSKVQSLYKLRGFPTSFLVDAEGKILVHHIGTLSEKQLDEYLLKVGVGNP